MDLKTVVKNDIFRSERGSGFGEPSGTAPPSIPRSAPPPGTQLINPFNKMGKVKIHKKKADLFLYNPNKGSAEPVSAQTSVPEVPSSISKCNLKSLFRYLFFPCSSKSFYIGIFVKRSSDEEGVGMRLSFVSENKDLYL